MRPVAILALWLLTPGFRGVDSVEGKSQDYDIYQVVDDNGEGVQNQFDCVSDYLDCRLWSREHKAWCLESEAVHCPGEELHGKRSHLMGVGMAWMLLGSVAVVMALFYLVNWPDKDIRRYSWNIISCTISIFTAVLMYQCVLQLIALWIPESHKYQLILMDFLVFVAFFISTTLSIAVVSGANFEGQFVDLGKEVWIVADTMRDDYGEEVTDESVRQPVGRKSIAVIDGVEVFVRKGKLVRERREQKMRCWAVLLAHMTGFAAQHLGARLQQLPLFKVTPFMTLLVVLMSQLMFTALFKVTSIIRERTQSLDGIVDERDELYNEYVEEAEIDAASLSVSFLATQAMRFWFTGVLPNVEGNEEPVVVHSSGSILSLYGVGFLLGISAVVVPMTVIPPYEKKHDRMRRFVETLQNQGLMTFSWCIFFATRYWCFKSQVLDPLGGPRSMGGRIVTAMGFSVFATLVIFVLDKIEDSAKAGGDKDSKRIERAVASIVSALGILVGFSWEVSFDGAIDAVASMSSNNRTLCRLLLAPALAMIIIPAWHQYIVEKVMLYRQMFIDESEAREIAGGWRTGAYHQLEHEENT